MIFGWNSRCTVEIKTWPDAGDKLIFRGKRRSITEKPWPSNSREIKRKDHNPWWNFTTFSTLLDSKLKKSKDKKSSKSFHFFFFLNWWCLVIQSSFLFFLHCLRMTMFWFFRQITEVFFAVMMITYFSLDGLEMVFLSRKEE